MRATGSGIRHHRVSAGGLHHHYATAGDGKPLVLLHGFPQTSRQWTRLIERLEGRFRIIAPSLRGLGGTPGPPSGYDTQSLAGDVRAILDAEDVREPAVVCGHDVGAYVAFAYALEYRADVAALALVDGPPPGTGLMAQLMLNPWAWEIAFHADVDVAHMLISGRERAYVNHVIASRIHDRFAVSPAEIDHYAAAYSAPGALRAALEMFRALPEDADLNRAALERGGRLEMPGVFVGNGQTAVWASLEQLVDEIAVDGRVEVVQDSGHWIAQEQPDVLARIVDELAATVRR